MPKPEIRNSLECLRGRGMRIGTVLDVGVMTKTGFLIDCFPDCHHILFEPVLEFHEEIRSAYAHLSFDLVGAAVADTAGNGWLKTDAKTDTGTTSHSALSTEGDGGAQIDKIRLDDFMEKSPQGGPYLLKIDVDGHELRVLRGATQVLRKTSVVICEVTVRNMVERISFLENRGFQVFDVVEPCYYDQALWQFDVVMCKSDELRHLFKDIDTNFDIANYQQFSAQPGENQ